ncbi:hypothetical protein [Aminicella lysinilytica]|jgi:hypothetical protein|uniref:hypothetical protein n=1 Tax=Aminicella lysinilytica TaxID=433323 RepID=UPI001804F222|nr:hypothetical protein [Aminicella lysinilytica]NLD10174.1 hypothetical protein [Clostridiales bacterium]
MKILARPVDMIATFSVQGKPTPYKFRYEDTYGHRIEVRIDKIISTESRKLAGIDSIVYTCQSEINQVMRIFELKYIVGQCRWELYKA